jgi:hypothetical protein
VLIGERKPHQVELVLFDRLLDRLGAARLFLGPQTVALDETQGTSLGRRHGVQANSEMANSE